MGILVSGVAARCRHPAAEQADEAGGRLRRPQLIGTALAGWAEQRRFRRDNRRPRKTDKSEPCVACRPRPRIGNFPGE